MGTETELAGDWKTNRHGTSRVALQDPDNSSESIPYASYSNDRVSCVLISFVVIVVSRMKHCAFV